MVALVDVEGLSYVEQVGLRQTLQIATGTRSDQLRASSPHRESNPATVVRVTTVDHQGGSQRRAWRATASTVGRVSPDQAQMWPRFSRWKHRFEGEGE